MKSAKMITLAFAPVYLALAPAIGWSEEPVETDTLALAPALNPMREWSVHVDIVRPGDDYFWDKGAGATVKYTIMQTPTRGFALSAGIQKWDVNEEIGLVSGNLGGGFVGAYAAQLVGDAQLIPLSALGVFRHEFSPGLQLNLEAGLSYVIVNSKVQYSEAIGIARGGRGVIDSYVSDVDIDNGFLAVFAADLRYRTNPSSKWTLFAGVGAQVDIAKGDVSYPATPITGAATDESELKATFFRFGLASDF